MSKTGNESIKSGFRILKPHTVQNGSFFSLIIKWLLSILSAILVFDLIFKGVNIQFDYEHIHRVIIITSSVFTLLQLNSIILALGCGFAAYRIYDYLLINKEVLKNGFKLMANQCYPIISKELNLPLADGFDDVANAYDLLNIIGLIAAVVIAVIMVIVVVWIGSKLLYGLGMSVTFAFLSFFNCDINFNYALMLIMCFMFMVTMDLCGAKSFKLNIIPIILKRYKKGIFNADVFYIFHTVLFCLIIFLITAYGFKHFYPREKFNTTFNKEYSENIKVTARDIAVMKYAEYKDFNVEGNISLGNLSFVSYAKPDVNSSEFAFWAEPERDRKLYFTSFIGEKYNYRYNNWTETADDNSVMTNALKNSGADSKLFKIRAYVLRSYMPCFSEYKNITYDENNDVKITGYDYKKVKINDEEYNNYVNNTYLTIDDRNREVIDKICSEQGFSKDDKDIDGKISAYFKNNFTYSTESDILPYGKDFVNYFLEESKTGNFINFASAQTLIYRAIGIPARYVSGYRVEPEQTLEQYDRRTGESYTPVKQANLFSWVEVYNKDEGWRTVDNIPAPSLEELKEKYGDDSDNKADEYTPDTSLENYFRTIDKEKYTPENMAKAGLKQILKWAVIIISAVVLLGILGIAVFLIIKYLIYVKSDNSKKAYILIENFKKRHKIKCTSYRDMKKFIALKKGEEKADKIIELAEKCMFSKNVSNEDIKRLKKLLF